MKGYNAFFIVLFGVLFINMQIAAAIDLARFYDAQQHQMQKRKGQYALRTELANEKKTN